MVKEMIPGEKSGKEVKNKSIPQSNTKDLKDDQEPDDLMNGEENGNGDRKTRRRSLIIDGTKYWTIYNSKFENRKKWINPDPKLVNSFIPGTVVKVFVKEGQVVKEGDDMLILEAMKMKNKVVFHRNGTVKSVMVKEGEKIPKNHVMIELK